MDDQIESSKESTSRVREELTKVQSALEDITDQLREDFKAVLPRKSKEQDEESS